MKNTYRGCRFSESNVFRKLSLFSSVRRGLFAGIAPALLVALVAAGALPAAVHAEGKTPGKQAAVSPSSDQAERHFKKAHEYFLEKNWEAAAAEIRKAAALLKQKAAVAASEGRKDLTASARGLEELADRVRKGAVNSVQELDDAFARAHYALARYHNLNAAESWARKATGNAGRELKAAAADLKRGLAWAGHKAETGTETAMKNARRLGEELIKGAHQASGTVGRTIQNLGTEIEKFGGKSGPAKKQ